MMRLRSTLTVRSARIPIDARTLAHMRSYRPAWDWQNMRGSVACLKWSFRDLQNLDRTIELVGHRGLAVQAGGNLGLFPKRLAESFDVVYTFEPDPVLFGHLKHNTRGDRMTRVQAALGDVTASVALACRRRDDSGRAVHEGLTHIAGPGELPQIRLDDLALPRCDLLYLDVEGYELRALQGAEATITAYRPVIGVEINANIAHYGASGDDLRAWLTRRGYRREFIANSDEVFVYAG
jgi:FkbM family methyltransferase